MAPILTRLGQSFGFGASSGGGGGGPTGMTASGGLISEYADGAKYYRAHTFNSNGRFVVTAESTSLPNAIEYVAVGGGGSGGASNGGGGGAGGFRTNLSGDPYAPHGISITASVTGGPGSDGVYPISIGTGGQGGMGESPRCVGRAGFDTVFTVSPTVNVTASGGGAGGTEGVPGGQQNGGDGGSGGGGNGYNSGAAGSTNPTNQGNIGQIGTNTGGPGRFGGGGGGAGSAGGSPSGSNGMGGDGHYSVLQYGPTTTNDSLITQRYAGGGGGGTGSGDLNCYSNYPNGKIGGAGSTPTFRPHQMGQKGGDGIGGGGGGSYNNHPGSAGGSGTVIIRYEIGAPESSPKVVGTRKASGGHMSAYNGKVIHIFTNDGTFKTKAGFSETVEYVIIGGGGGGGTNGSGSGQSGGGGAGGYKTNSLAVATPTATEMAIKCGRGGSGATGPTTNTFYPAGEVGGEPSEVTFPTGMIYAGGGGAGGNSGNDGGNGSDGGSGGGCAQGPGSGGTSTGDPFPGTVGATPTNGWGRAGGANPGPGHGGGGGGAGGEGGTGPGGAGGIGVQLPTTFRNPKMAPDSNAAAQTLNIHKGGGLGTPGPAGMWYMCGGGGGHQSPNGPTSIAGGYGGGGSSYAPGNSGQGYQYAGGDAIASTGSGGGAGCAPGGSGGAGSDGIVLLAYPE